MTTTSRGALAAGAAWITLGALVVGSIGLGVGLAVDDLAGSGDRTDRRTDAITGGANGLSVTLANADLRQAADCDALLASFVERGLEQVGPWGWTYDPLPYPVDDGPVFAAPETRSESADSSVEGGSLPSTSRAESGESGTNVQEAGVDEADLVKADGGLLVRLRDGDLRVYDVSGAEPTLLGSLALEHLADDAEMLLSDGVVTVVGTDTRGQWLREQVGATTSPRTRVVTVDLADPGSPAVTDERVVDAGVEAVRMHDDAGTDVVRLVLQGDLPDLDFTTPPMDGVTPQTEEDYERALEANRDVVRATTLEDWIPTVTVGDGEPQPLVDCASVAVPTDDGAPLGLVAVAGFGAGTPGEVTTSAVATTAATTYVSGDRLYLAQGESVPCCLAVDTLVEPSDPAAASRILPPQGDGTTALYAFALDGTGATYVASGEVEGTVRDRWSMDESAGVLRVAVGQSSATGNFNSVVTLREEGSELVEAGRVDGLGVDEEIKSVRWFDDLAVVVTFRQVDPLYAVDLSDPAAPAALGELKIPGFSEYLHPLGSMRMIGIGQDASLDGRVRGAQAALYDMSDLTAPRQLDTVAYPEDSQAGAGLDPRQFTWLPERRVALTVVSQGWSGRTGWVSVLRVGDGELQDELVEVEHGEDVDQVRLVPLADDRVVLVTGEDVSFFDV